MYIVVYLMMFDLLVFKIQVQEKGQGQTWSSVSV